jgi:Fur family peroxide stress response transcriptional regulator
MTTDYLREKLAQKGLKVTPQRIAIYNAVVKLNNHPTAEKVFEHISKDHPSISLATVYKVLESLVASELLKKVKSDKGGMRYDAVLSPHHHLYSSNTDQIEDYVDEQLDSLIEEYFKKKKIKGFTIQEIKLQITGKFKK